MVSLAAPIPRAVATTLAHEVPIAIAPPLGQATAAVAVATAIALADHLLALRVAVRVRATLALAQWDAVDNVNNQL